MFLDLEIDENLGFFYPQKQHAVYFDWPWNISGSFLEWFYSKWSFKNKESKITFFGQRIFGFTKLRIKWDCSPEEAIFIYRQNRKIFYEKIHSSLTKEDKCCKHKCKCHDGDK